jgi:AcrR family transcriptional regulator
MDEPVTWGPPSAERADAARNRRLLLATAREIITGQGVAKLRLAERAGLGKGTVFRRFGTRAGIFAALLDDDERHFQEQVLSGPPAAGAWRPAAGSPDRLRPRQDRIPHRAPRDRACRAGRQGVGASRVADAHVACTHQVSARADAPGRRRPRRPGHPAHRGPGRPAAALPVVRHPHRDRAAISGRLGHGWEDLVQRVCANHGRSAERRDSSAIGPPGPHRSST